MSKEMDPKMHSAEHILNQTMVRMFGCGRCFSAHIEKKKSKCDYHFDRALAEEEIREIEARVNDVIRSGAAVKEEFITREEADEAYHLDRLPAAAGERIRIIRIGDYDACPCAGPHVQSTGDIGEFQMISSSFDHSVLRMRYRLK